MNPVNIISILAIIWVLLFVAFTAVMLVHICNRSRRIDEEFENSEEDKLK